MTLRLVKNTTNVPQRLTPGGFIGPQAVGTINDTYPSENQRLIAGVFELVESSFSESPQVDPILASRLSRNLLAGNRQIKAMVDAPAAVGAPTITVDPTAAILSIPTPPFFNALASALRTTNSQTAWMSAAIYGGTLKLNLSIAAVGPGTLTLTIEGADDTAGTNLTTLGSWPARSAAVNEIRSYTTAKAYYRIRWTITGTSVTFGVSVLRDAIDPVFRVLNRGALVPSPIGSYSDQSGPLALAPNPTGATEVKNPWWLSFQHYGTKFAAHLSGKNNTFRLWTNGSPSTAAGQILTTDFNKHYVLFDWGGSPQWRDLMLEFSPGTTLDASTLIGGLIIEPTATLGPPIRHSPVKGAVLGDSLGEGRDADDRSRGYVQRTFRLLGYDDVVSVSLGGTGVLTDGGNAGGKYIERAPALYAFVPDIVVVQASVNDGTPNGAGGLVQPAATTLLNDIKSNLPNAYIFVLGILYANDFTAQYLAVHNEWKAACATVGVTFIDTQNPLLSWGSGRVGATTGDGPADLFANTGASNPHPSQAGHDNNANRLAPLIAAVFGIPVG